ncbi:tumor necrosis factor receptor superfamily member 6 [Symphorus nematophorus]
MMAADQNKLPLWFITLVLFFFLALESVFSSSPCADGTYDHDGRKCCQCRVGSRLVKHCTTNLQYGECEDCESGWYTSSPNSQMSCEPCTSCSHPNENLEEDEPCTPGRDRKCRCKKDHYCFSQPDICRLCHPCKNCGDEGIKVPCSGTNNTVCNEIEGENVGRTVGIVAGLLTTIVLAGVGVFIWRRRRAKKEQDLRNGHPADEEAFILKDVDLKRLLPDIADVIGWKDMHRIAIRSGMLTTTIDNCQTDHPNDSEQRTLQLLNIWVERQGRKAAENLIRMLHDTNKNSKAEEVEKIFRDSQNHPA